MRSHKTRSTRDRSIPRSLRRQDSTKSSISQLTFFHLIIYTRHNARSALLYKMEWNTLEEHHWLTYFVRYHMTGALQWMGCDGWQQWPKKAWWVKHGWKHAARCDGWKTKGRDMQLAKYEFRQKSSTSQLHVCSSFLLIYTYTTCLFLIYQNARPNKRKRSGMK